VPYSVEVTRTRSVLLRLPARTLVVALGLAIGLAIAGGSGSARAAALAPPEVSSLTTSPVTVYSAKWCSACRLLERGLNERKIAFDTVDVDANPAAFTRAREAAGATSAIPLTGIVRSSSTVWIVGADVDAVDRAQRGE
jgi:glutaredoxin